MKNGGTGAHLSSIVGRPCAGKTGTTDQFKDAWFVGYTPYLCCAVWTGYDDNRPVNQSGGVLAGPIWANFIKTAAASHQPSDFPRPQGIKRLNICMDSGLVAAEACPRPVSMAFIAGTEPGMICYWHQFELPLPDCQIYWIGFPWIGLRMKSMRNHNRGISPGFEENEDSGSRMEPSFSQ